MNTADVTDPPAVEVPQPPVAPVKRIDVDTLNRLGLALVGTFDRYSSDRFQAEQKWLRSLRQYLGIYDPEIESMLGAKRSRAYPKLTRVKAISTMSRVMNLMFPGSERNWQLKASPNAELDPADAQQAVQTLMQKMQQQGQQVQLTPELVQMAVNELAADRARELEIWIDDQLQELGGDQTQDYVSLNRSVVKSGIMYGLGLLRGPFVKASKSTSWGLASDNTTPAPTTTDTFKPQYEFLSVWDFYPDMSAKTLKNMDGYFIRLVFSRAQLIALARRNDFFPDVIKSYVKNNGTGNYKARNFETELRNMGVRTNVSDQARSDVGGKYEVLIWNGPISGEYLQAAGADVPDDKLTDDLEAEVWLLDGKVIKCDINAWRKLDMEVCTIHPFVFDDDDTSPVGNGLPQIMRDSQMSLCAATRMMLDNASVVCGPNLEINRDLMVPDQDISQIEAYKIWYREGSGQEAQFPAVRPITIDSHLPELSQMIEQFQKFADSETFVGPQTGGDMDRGMKSSEPMRSPTGAAMMRSDAALPFKDIVRSFDAFTQSVIYSVVQFNTKFNPHVAPAGDYNVIARGATSLVAKEIRGMQIDQLAASLTDEEKMEIDPRKLARARFEVRDLDDMLVSESESNMRRQQRDQAQAQTQQQQQQMVEAQVRQLLSQAFKNITQGQKNSATADATTVDSALVLLEKGLDDATQGAGQGGGTTGSDQGKTLQ